MKFNLTLLAILIFLSGCRVVEVNSKSWHRINSDKIKNYTKEGKTCSNRIFFVRSGYSDLTIESAKKNAKIEEVVFVEKTTNAFLPFPIFILYIPSMFLEECIIVKGN